MESAAVDRFVRTVELLEMTLLLLDIASIVRARRVNKTFLATIDSSIHIARKLFLRPDSTILERYWAVESTRTRTWGVPRPDHIVACWKPGDLRRDAAKRFVINPLAVRLGIPEHDRNGVTYSYSLRFDLMPSYKNDTFSYELVGRMFIIQSPVFEIELYPTRSQHVSVRNVSGITVSDVLAELYRHENEMSSMILLPNRSLGGLIAVLVDEENRLMVEYD